MAKLKNLKSDLALVDSDRITVCGLDLSRDLIGCINLGDMAFLLLKKRLPTSRESAVFNAVAVSFAEHGIEAATVVARMVYTNVPEALQSAVGAGLCAMGGGLSGDMEIVARMLQEALPDPKAHADLQTLANEAVAHRTQDQNVPGVGHHFHTPTDPRTQRLFEVARANGFDGPYLELMKLTAARASEVFRKELSVNAQGAIGAILSELGLPWQVARGVGVTARAIGLVGHILEEVHDPMSREITARVKEESAAHLRGPG